MSEETGALLDSTESGAWKQTQEELPSGNCDQPSFRGGDGLPRERDLGVMEGL